MKLSKIIVNLIFAFLLLFSSNVFAVTAEDIENADPKGQTVEFWVQYSDERLDAMKARAQRFEAETGIKVNVVHKGHYGKVQSAKMSAAGTSDIGDVARGYGNAAGYKNSFILAPNYPAGKDALTGYKRFFKGKIEKSWISFFSVLIS